MTLRKTIEISNRKDIIRPCQTILFRPTTSTSRTSKVTTSSTTVKKAPVQSKMMGRIKFGSDDEADAAPKEDATPVSAQVETVKFENKDDDEEVKIGRRSSRRSKCLDSFLLFLVYYFSIFKLKKEIVG